MPKLMEELGKTLGLSDEALAEAAALNAANEAITTDETAPKEEVRVTGKIIKVAKDSEKGGYGFISSKAIPFTRIFFHWSSLKPGKVKFEDLKNGMVVSFVAFEVEGKGYRAIKVKVED